MNNRDPIEILRVLARRQSDEFGEAPDPDVVLRRILAGRPEQTHVVTPNRRRRQIIAGVVAVVLSAGGGAVWAISRHQPAANPTTITCHQMADLKSSQIVVAADGTDPLQLCARAWTVEFPEWGPLPPLVACAVPSGVAAVFPGDSATCDRLDLASLDTTLGEQDRKLIEFEDAITAELLGKGCLPPEHVKSIVDARLSRSGLLGWSVTIEGAYTTGEPCGSLSFDVAARIITIRPLPDMFTNNPGG